MAQSVIEQAAPGRKLVAITPSNTVNFTDGACRMIYVGVSGDVAVVPPEGSAVTLLNVPVGILNMAAIRVNSTGTDATDLVAIY